MIGTLALGYPAVGCNGMIDPNIPLYHGNCKKHISFETNELDKGTGAIYYN